MSSSCAKCRFCCVVVRLLCYRMCCKWCRPPPRQKDNWNILVLGLKDAGKSHLLATVCGEAVAGLVPTQGFSIKDVSLERSILHMKEVGGADNIRPFWHHYYLGVDGIVFVVDGSHYFDQEASVQSALFNCVSDRILHGKPLLMLINKVSSLESGDGELIVSRLKLDKLRSSRDVMTACMLENQTLSDIVHTLELFADMIRQHKLESPNDSVIAGQL